MTPLMIVALILGALIVIRIILLFVMPDLRMGIGIILIAVIVIFIAVVAYYMYTGSTFAELFVW